MTAFNSDGFSYIPADACSKDITHEVIHSFGKLYYDSTGNYNMNYNAISEAVTETIACSMGLEAKTTVTYTCNVEFVKRMTQQLEIKGYKNAFLDAYLSSDSTKIKNIIDGIAGEGFYDEIALRFVQIQSSFVNAHKTGDWGEYNKISDEMDVFLNALD